MTVVLPVEEEMVVVVLVLKAGVVVSITENRWRHRREDIQNTKKPINKIHNIRYPSSRPTKE